MTAREFGCIELWVGNARHAVSYLTHAFGFETIGLRGGEPDDRISYLLQQGMIQVAVTGATRRDSPVAEFVRRHGDGVRDITLTGDTTDEGQVIAAFGETVHTVVPGPLPVRAVGPVGLHSIDHVAVSLEAHTREDVVARYVAELGFDRLGAPTEHVDIGASSFAMSSIRARGGRATLVFAEPGDGPSQIADFLTEYDGPGVHHVAFATNDIISTARALRQRGVGILPVPSVYYQDAHDRHGDLDLPWGEIEELGILVASDEDGVLLQAFTEAIGDRPTLYFEIIERAGATGFGADNIRALYHAVVLQQARP